MDMAWFSKKRNYNCFDPNIKEVICLNRIMGLL